MSEFSAGQEFRVVYPFIKCTYTSFDEEGSYEENSWKPGVRYEPTTPYGDGDAVSDGDGLQILTVVDVHKPGKYPTRVFYTVKWVRPDGREFGKGKLRIATAEKFGRLSRGFMSHECMFDWRNLSDEEDAA